MSVRSAVKMFFEIIRKEASIMFTGVGFEGIALIYRDANLFPSV